MDFTIVTPSFRQLDWLECCIASIADQEGISVEHVVQDAGTEGFALFSKKMAERWPDREGYQRVMISEQDSGMYDAINKGLKRGSGRICAYLNCDEQYLPGALAKVKEAFTKNPQSEILYGGFLVVNEKGELVTAQKPVRMFLPHVATSHLPNFTCATFFLRSMLERDQAWFDPSYRACGDAVWVMERLRQRTSSKRIRSFLAAFLEQPTSQGLSKIGAQEASRLRKAQSLRIQRLAGVWKWLHRATKLFSGGYLPAYVSTGLFVSGPGACPRRPLRGFAWPFWKTRLHGRPVQS